MAPFAVSRRANMIWRSATKIFSSGLYDKPRMIDQPKIWDFGEEVNGLPVAMLLGMYFEKKAINYVQSNDRVSP